MKKIIAIIGARPQFIKHAPIQLASAGKVNLKTIHTGQHYDYNMSQVFFDQLRIKKPDYNLEVGSGSHAVQTGKILIDVEKILIAERPDAILLYGDTNSTLAGAISASKLSIPIFHIEAGLRSYNKGMPEEINRVLTDHVSDLLFVPTDQAALNLAKEGIVSGVVRTGDIMCDMIRIVKDSGLINEPRNITEPFLFVTLHRPYNTDDNNRLIAIIETLKFLPYRIKFAIHPRTYKRTQELGISFQNSNIEVCDPLSYIDTISSIQNCLSVITDSGGIQKEAYILKKKCITLRSETEWVETLKGGWNTLVFDNLNQIQECLNIQPTSEYKNYYGDGHAADFIVDKIASYLS